MTRYVAFLRGVSPMNCRMPELKRCFEAAGYTEVKTLLSSGNVAFTAKPEIVPVLEERVERAMGRHLDRVFATIVRPSGFLQSLVEADAWAGFELPENAKPVITFLRRPHEGPVTLPPEGMGRDEGRILKLQGTEVYSYYISSDTGSALAALLERTFGKHITTRTLGTVRKCAAA